MRRQLVGRVHGGGTLWAIAATALVVVILVAGCASDPAPNAPCHGPWVWLPAAPPAGGQSPGEGGSGAPRVPAGNSLVGTAPAQPVPVRSPAAPQVPVPHGD